MKQTIVITLFTTGVSIVLSTVFLAVMGMYAVPIHTVFEVFGANIVINMGLLLTRKIECRSLILEYVIDISYIIAVLVLFGALFGWYSAVPVYALVVMAVIVYILTLIFSAAKIKKDTDKINTLLRKRREKESQY
jgi:uncharacterized membrane protein